jgi:putative tryptophan/tyrosine transport system substrate-binding protein
VRRREFIGLVGGVAVAWPLAARAQQPLVGFLSSRSPGESADLVTAFRTGLRQMGFVEGQNVIITFRWAEGHYDRLPGLSSDLVDVHASVIFAAGGSPTAFAAKAATSNIPIVFVASDPVLLGLVRSLNQPGGNITGITNASTEVGGKALGLLKQMMPTAETIGYLVNPSSPSAKIFLGEARGAAKRLGIELRVLNASTPADLDQVFTTLEKQRVGALAVMGDPFFDAHRDRLIELSAQHRMPGCYPWREYVLAGGLMSYGTNLAESYRQAGIYAGRLLRGESPSTLPVMQPTKFEFVLNVNTAKTLGLTVPPGLLSIADEVIE